MKRLVLLAGTAAAMLGCVLLAVGYGAAGILCLVLAAASVTIALTVTWRLADEHDSDGKVPGGASGCGHVP